MICFIHQHLHLHLQQPKRSRSKHYYHFFELAPNDVDSSIFIVLLALSLSINLRISISLVLSLCISTFTIIIIFLLSQFDLFHLCWIDIVMCINCFYWKSKRIWKKLSFSLDRLLSSASFRSKVLIYLHDQTYEWIFIGTNRSFFFLTVYDWRVIFIIIYIFGTMFWSHLNTFSFCVNWRHT